MGKGQPPDDDSARLDERSEEYWASRRKKMAKLCAWCRRYQSADGTWQPGRRASDATIETHGICPDCATKVETDN